MGNGQWRGTWLRQIALAIGYAIIYEAQHPFSAPQFFLGSAVRLICLLFVPYRYWAALAVGEAIPNWLVVYPCLDQLGAAWVAVRAIPPIVVVMPAVWWCRSRLALFPTDRLTDIKALLVCILASSLAWTGYSYLALNLAIIQPGDAHPRPIMALGYFTGNYFAILALVPWALIARFEYRIGQWREKLRRAWESRLVLEGWVIMLPAAALLGFFVYRHDKDYQELILGAMFLPVALLTLQHGWRGAAFGGTIAIICAAIVVPSQWQDASATVIQAELFLAGTITALFALGAQISSHKMRERQQLQDALSIQKLARQSYQQGELRQRQIAQTLEHVASTLYVSYGRLLQQRRHISSVVDDESHYLQAISAHKQLHLLAERLHPMAWRERGLPAALNDTVGGALDEAGIAYSCKIVGRGFTRAQPAVLSAAYRAACEAIVYVSTQVACSSIQLTLRGGETNDARWIFVGVEGLIDETKVANVILDTRERQRLAAKLGASGLDLGELHDHVCLFDGEVHHRTGRQRFSVTVLLHDPQKTGRRRDLTSAAGRLWVQ